MAADLGLDLMKFLAENRIAKIETVTLAVRSGNKKSLYCRVKDSICLISPIGQITSNFKGKILIKF